jgi:hypothetical protein
VIEGIEAVEGIEEVEDLIPLLVKIKGRLIKLRPLTG